MAQQILNLGTSANDHTGDTARAAGGKLNAMLAELYAQSGAGGSLTLADITALTGKGNAAKVALGLNTSTPVASNTITLSPSDDYVPVTHPSGPATVNLEPNPVDGTEHTIQDASGNAATYPITIVASSGTLINGQANFVLNWKWGSVKIRYGNGAWGITATAIFVVTASGAVVYALDSATSRVAGGSWGTRKRRSAYSGTALTLVRVSDGTPLDIGYVGQDLDQAAAMGFIGTGTGIVTVLKDNDGLGRDFTATVNTGPALITGGVMNTIGGKPALLFSGNQTMSTAPITVSASQMTARAVVTLNGTGGNVNDAGRILDMWAQADTNDIGTSSQIPLLVDDGPSVQMFRAGAAIVKPGGTPSSPMVLSAKYGATNATLDINGTDTSAAFAAAAIGSPFTLILGSANPGYGGFLKGSIGEVDLGFSAYSSGDDTALRHEAGSYYTIYTGA